MEINLKQKLKDNEITIGSWITIPDPIIAEIMSKYFEWLVIDMEHSAITLDKAQNIIRILSLTGCPALVRVNDNNPISIKGAMDSGASGVIVPMVNSREDALKALNAVHYPPQGTRGVGLARAQDYGFGFDAYNHWQKKEPIVIAQIEHITGVNNLPSILQTPIDGIIVGPYDLSGSIGIPGEFNSPAFIKLTNKIIKISKEYKKPLGYHVIQPKKCLVAQKIKEGYTFIAFSIDTLFLGTKIKEELNGIKNI
jgi:2-dehydro-3-deoxyglucarate aldolase